MKLLNVALIGGLAYLLFSSFKGKEQPVNTDPAKEDPEPNNNLQGKLVTASGYTNPTHPYFDQVPMFVKRFYEQKHLVNNPFSTASGVLPAFTSAFTYMKSGIEVSVYEEADYQPGRKICRITNFTQDKLTDDLIVKFLASAEKLTKLYWSNQGIALPLKEVPKKTPYNFNIWVLKENLKTVPASLSSI